MPRWASRSTPYIFVEWTELGAVEFLTALLRCHGSARYTAFSMMCDITNSEERMFSLGIGAISSDVNPLHQVERTDLTPELLRFALKTFVKDKGIGRVELADYLEMSERRLAIGLARADIGLSFPTTPPEWKDHGSYLNTHKPYTKPGRTRPSRFITEKDDLESYVLRLQRFNELLGHPSIRMIDENLQVPT